MSAKKKANADTPLGSMQMLKAATKVGLGWVVVVMMLDLVHNVC